MSPLHPSCSATSTTAGLFFLETLAKHYPVRVIKDGSKLSVPVESHVWVFFGLAIFHWLPTDQNLTAASRHPCLLRPHRSTNHSDTIKAHTTTGISLHFHGIQAASWGELLVLSCSWRLPVATYHYTHCCQCFVQVSWPTLSPRILHDNYDTLLQVEFYPRTLPWWTELTFLRLGTG